MREICREQETQTTSSEVVPEAKVMMTLCCFGSQRVHWLIVEKYGISTRDFREWAGRQQNLSRVTEKEDRLLKESVSRDNSASSSLEEFSQMQGQHQNLSCASGMRRRHLFFPLLVSTWPVRLIWPQPGVKVDFSQWIQKKSRVWDTVLFIPIQQSFVKNQKHRI